MRYWKNYLFGTILGLALSGFVLGIIYFPSLIIISLLIIPIIGVVAYLIYWKWKWNRIERINKQVEITRKNVYIDKNGYLRWKKNDRLCHRDIAWENNIRLKGRRFGTCDIHHIDENKFNNNPENLAILTREKHQLEHDQILYERGQKFIRLVPAHRPRRETKKAILIGGKHGQWYPKSQLIIRKDYIYATEWIVDKKQD